MIKRLLTLTMLIWVITDGLAQERTVTGKVISEEDGVELPGVNILIKGTSSGTVTDINGRYSIVVPEGATLIYTSIGFAMQEVVVGEQAVINLGMLPDTRQLSEIVVTAFGIKRSKKALGYSVQDLDNKELAEARQANVVNSLSGKIAGIQISPGAGVGGGSNVTIRGMTSISNSNQPLYVIDGVPMENSLDPFSSIDFDGSDFNAGDNNTYGGGISEISPDNIKSITVLKGPSAAALYGSRAANGVILITTKDGSGSEGIRVEVNSNYTFEKPFIKPEFQNIYGGGNGYVTWYADGRNSNVQSDGLDDFYTAYPNFQGKPQGTAGVDESWGAPMDGRLVRTWWSGNQTVPLVPVEDMWSNYWETGQSMTNNIAISSSNEKGSFRVSIGRLDQQGIYYNNDFRRDNFNLNLNYNFTDKLNVKASSSYIKSGSDNRQSPILWDVYTWHHRHDDWGLLKNWKDYADVHITRDGDQFGYANWQHTFARNRFHEQDFLTNSQDKDRFLGNIALTYEFNRHISLMIRTGTDLWTDTRLDIFQDARTKNFVSRNEAFSEEVLRKQETNTDFILTLGNSFGNFDLSAQLGGVHRTNYFKQNFTQVNEVTINGIYNTSNNAIPNTDRSYLEESEFNSLFGSVRIGYKDFVFLDVTGRNDWASTLPSDNNAYFYPSFSLSTVLTDALDIRSPVLSFMKLRASWAQVGNAATPFQLAQVFKAQNPWNGDVPAFGIDDIIANANLRNETTTGIELGADIRLLGGKIGLDVTYYDQTTTDQIIPVEISKATGFNEKIINAGKIVNKGIEMLLTARPVELSNSFTWDVTVNFARNRNEVVELVDGLETIVLQSRRGLSLEARRGQPYGTFFGTAYKRAPDGQLIFKDGVPELADELQIIGNVAPDWIGGIQNSFSFKGITLSALVDMKMGGDIADESTSTGMQTGIYPITAIGREEGVIGQGVKNIGTEESPNYVPNDVVLPTKSVTRYLSVRSVNESAIYDASYIKLRELRVSYALPASLLSNFANGFIKSAHVSFVGINVAMLWKNHPQMDPEVNVRGGNLQGGLLYRGIPSTRSLGFNVNLTF